MASQTFQLVMRTGPNPGKAYDLTQDEITIGRDITNGIVVNDAEVSRRHTRFRAQAGGYVVEDMGSTNGTFVNGQRLMGPHVLRPGEQIMLGEHVAFVYEAMAYDPNATLVSGGQAPGAYETYRVPQPSPMAPAPAPVDYQPAYSGQVPMGPPDAYAQPGPAPYEAYEEEPPARSNRVWLYVIIGLAVILVCVCVVGFVAVDALRLYCTGPLRFISEMFGFDCVNYVR